tara:strand:- start:1099 stop:1296 length:198 start_codon:yes stop_codon:yes gene_type:complete
MLFFGLEIIVFTMLFYSMNELLSCKSEDTSIITTLYYQPPPLYEEINQTDTNNNSESELPPSYRE